MESFSPTPTSSISLANPRSHWKSLESLGGERTGYKTGWEWSFMYIERRRSRRRGNVDSRPVEPQLDFHLTPPVYHSFSHFHPLRGLKPSGILLGRETPIHWHSFLLWILGYPSLSSLTTGFISVTFGNVCKSFIQ